MLTVDYLKIKAFRKFEEDSKIKIGKNITLIVGQNATSKSTVLGMICQPFEFTQKYKSYTNVYDGIEKSKTRTISGDTFESDYSKVFRMSLKYDDPEVRQYIYEVGLKSNEQEQVLEVKSNKRTDQTNNKLRFVVGRTRKKGEGNYPHPVIYLGLSRLFPLANSKNVSLNENFNLTDDEKEFYSKWMASITVVQENTTPEYVSTEYKEFLGFKTDCYDAEAISAGQDNLGQFITAVLSFDRLKKKLGENYQGGLLVIDELDATLHVLVQEKLLEFLIWASENLQLQIVATTHSQHIIKLCCRNYKNMSKVIYLFKREGIVKVANNPTFEAMSADLEAIVAKKEVAKTTVLFEDDRGAEFFKFITQNKFSAYLNIPSYSKGNEVSLSSDVLLKLAAKRIKEFENIIFVIDGDKGNEITRAHRNLLALPCKLALEHQMYLLLKDLPENDSFWGQELGEYNKQICFRNFGSIPSASHTQEYKNWFLSQKAYWGRANNKLYKRWQIDHKDECVTFIKNFVEKLKKVSVYSKQLEEIEKDLLKSLVQ